MAREVFSILKKCNKNLECVGFTGNSDQKSLLPNYYLGEDSHLEEIFSSGVKNACIAIGDINMREKLFKSAKNIGFVLPAIIHDSATLLTELKNIEEGSFIYPNSILMNDVKVGKGAIVNSGSVITHDVKIGDFVNINPNSTIGGCTSIGDKTLIGLGASIRDCIKIGESSIIGMGSVVVRNVAPFSRVLGNPARKA